MNKYITIICLLSITLSSFAQNDKGNARRELISGMGTEGVYLHYTHNLLFTGEYVHFKLYALSNKTKGFSPFSKIAYVELLDHQGKRKLIRKVKLEDGTGHGDFFIPTNFSSGIYRLTAYTRYMLNWPQQNFFQDHVVIINPYSNDQRSFLEQQKKDPLITTDAQPLTDSPMQNNEQGGNTGINLHLNKKVYTTREEVVLQLDSDDEHFGNYSVSVRKIPETLFYKQRQSPVTYLQGFTTASKTETNHLQFLPELRGEIFEGTLNYRSELMGEATQKVLYSLPGDKYELGMAETDKNGDFVFSLNTDNLTPEALFQVAASKKEASPEITILPPPAPEIRQHDITPFHLDPSMKQEILERSIHNQVENAYFELKPDTINISNDYTPFYGKASTVYALDDYTRFSSFEETLIEIIDDAWIDTDKEGKQSIFIRDYANTNTKFGYKALVIADGVVVDDHADLISFNVNSVKTIRLIRKQFNLGGQIYQGIFDLTTFNEEFLTNFKFRNNPVTELLRPLPEKHYYQQTYNDSNTDGTIPDFRQQLYWNPELNIDSAGAGIRFFTSDVKGNYEILIEGFTTKGQPIKIRKSFNVK